MVTAPAEMPSEGLASMANLAMDIRKVIDDALSSAIPEPWEVSDHATKAILALFAPIRAEKERERAFAQEWFEGVAKENQALIEKNEALEHRALAAEAALAGERERADMAVRQMIKQNDRLAAIRAQGE